MLIFHCVPFLRVHLINFGRELMAVEIIAIFEMTYVTKVILTAGTRCQMVRIAGAESGILSTAMVIADALESP